MCSLLHIIVIGCEVGVVHERVRTLVWNWRTGELVVTFTLFDLRAIALPCSSTYPALHLCPNPNKIALLLT